MVLSGLRVPDPLADFPGNCLQVVDCREETLFFSFVTHLQNVPKRGLTTEKTAFLLGFLHGECRFGSREAWAFVSILLIIGLLSF